MSFAKNIMTALALIVAALSMFFACSRNEGTILTENSAETTPPEATPRTFSTHTIVVGDATCPYGGLGLDTCVDLNGDAVCSAEVDRDFTSQSICNSPTEDICSSDEPPGSRCPAGGLKLQKFNDLDEDGVCDADEPFVAPPSYVCNSPATMSMINGAADGVIDNADAGANLVVVENPYASFDEEAYAIVSASTSSCNALVDGDFTLDSAPTAGNPGFVPGSTYKICARYRVGTETKLLLSPAFQRN